MLCKLCTSSRERASATVTVYSEGPTKANLKPSPLTVKAWGPRWSPRATVLGNMRINWNSSLDAAYSAKAPGNRTNEGEIGRSKLVKLESGKFLNKDLRW